MKQPLKILIEDAVYSSELYDDLTKKGHIVELGLACDIDVIIGYNAWRIPPMTKPEAVRKYIDSIIKQVRATKHVQTTTEAVSPKRTTAKPRKATRRKRDTAGASTTLTVSARAKRQSRTGSLTEGPSLATVNDGKATDQATQ